MDQLVPLELANPRTLLGVPSLDVEDDPVGGSPRVSAQASDGFPHANHKSP